MKISKRYDIIPAVMSMAQCQVQGQRKLLDLAVREPCDEPMQNEYIRALHQTWEAENHLRLVTEVVDAVQSRPSNDEIGFTANSGDPSKGMLTIGMHAIVVHRDAAGWYCTAGAIIAVKP